MHLHLIIMLTTESRILHRSKTSSLRRHAREGLLLRHLAYEPGILSPSRTLESWGHMESSMWLKT